MFRRIAAIIAVYGSGVLGSAPAAACTTVCLFEEGRAVVAYNYDFYSSEGFVLVNKKGTAKKSWMGSGAATWTAKYGSITFNQFGRDNPTTGMNEAGLMVSLMWLNGTEYPPDDDRPVVGILEWIQYHLDTNASVAEVVSSAAQFRTVSTTPIHYLFADSSGDAAVIEFLEGELVIHRGDEMPVKALANSTYAHSLTALKTFKKTGVLPAEEARTQGPMPGFGSLDRFVRGALLSSAAGDPVTRGFGILGEVSQGSTRWSIVYDLGAGEVHFKTDTNPNKRRVSSTDFDFSCASPVQMLDLMAPGSGFVQSEFVDYTTDANRTLLNNSLSGRPDRFIEKIALHPERTSECEGGN